MVNPTKNGAFDGNDEEYSPGVLDVLPTSIDATAAYFMETFSVFFLLNRDKRTRRNFEPLIKVRADNSEITYQFIFLLFFTEYIYSFLFLLLISTEVIIQVHSTRSVRSKSVPIENHSMARRVVTFSFSSETKHFSE